jgi:hypothetical protein
MSTILFRFLDYFRRVLNSQQILSCQLMFHLSRILFILHGFYDLLLSKGQFLLMLSESRLIRLCVDFVDMSELFLF